jgi:hypothetical protein
MHTASAHVYFEEKHTASAKIYLDYIKKANGGVKISKKKERMLTALLASYIDDTPKTVDSLNLLGRLLTNPDLIDEMKDNKAIKALYYLILMDLIE